jgi:hypothetical protein
MVRRIRARRRRRTLYRARQRARELLLASLFEFVACKYAEFEAGDQGDRQTQ